MHTQITCPQCGTPYTAEVHQFVDSKQTPHLKQQLLNGQLNMAVCPSCGYGGQMSTILLFHDAEFEKFIVHIPQQMNLETTQREQMIGQLTRQAMDSLPPEERRAYMFQPQIIINMQTFMEEVLETEGITKEMIAHQRKQAELLANLAQADKDVADYLIKENLSQIDDAFFAMLQTYIDAASQMNDDTQLLPLINLRAKLMTQTPVGKRIERRQMAVHALVRDSKKAGNLTPQMLLDHILKNLNEQDIINGLLSAGQSALTYEFFSLMTAEIEKQEKLNKDTAQQLTTLRDELLEWQQAMREQSEQAVKAAMETLQAVIEAPDKEAALAANADKIDDFFMEVLQMQIAQAQQQGNQELLQAFVSIYDLIVQKMEEQMPPNVQFLNNLVRTESLEDQQKMLDENAELLSEDTLNLVDRIIEQTSQSADEILKTRLQQVKSLISARVGQS